MGSLRVSRPSVGKAGGASSCSGRRTMGCPTTTTTTTPTRQGDVLAARRRASRAAGRAMSRARIVASSSLGDEGDVEDDWDEIDKLMRELEDEERRRGREEETSAASTADSESAGDGGAGGAAKEQKAENLQKLTVSELKDRLRTLGLPVSGRKAELIERLNAAGAPTLDQAASPEDPSGADALLSSWDDSPGLNFDDMAPGPYALGKPIFGQADLVSAPVDPALAATSPHFEQRSLAPSDADEAYVAEVPANSEAMLRGYDHLPEGYTWRCAPGTHPKFPNHAAFSLATDVDFLVRAREDAIAMAAPDDGRLFLDLADVLLYHKPTEVYSRPKIEGQLPETSGIFQEYYAYPVAGWFPGDALRDKSPEQEIVKIILVAVKESELVFVEGEHSEEAEDAGGHEEEQAAMAAHYGEDFELDITKSFVLDGSTVTVQGMNSPREQNLADYETCRSGKSGHLTTTRSNAFSFPKPLLLRFNEGTAAENGDQSFGLVVSAMEGLSLQRWETMKDPSVLVEENQKLGRAAAKAAAVTGGVEKGSPFEFLGTVSGKDVDEEYRALHEPTATKSD